MDCLKENEGSEVGCISRVFASCGTFFVSIFHGLLLTPWLICFYYFAFKEDYMDPKHCWVVDGDYRVWAENPGLPLAEDIGVQFNEWVLFNWYVNLIAFICPFVASICACGIPYCLPCMAVPSCVWLLCIVARVVGFVWACILRFSETGFTASGDNIVECKAANDPSTFTMRNGTEVDACTPEDVYQKKTGKLLIAIIIISLLTL